MYVYFIGRREWREGRRREGREGEDRMEGS